MGLWVQFFAFTVLSATWRRSTGQINDSPSFTDTISLTITPSSTIVMPSTIAPSLCQAVTPPAQGSVTYGSTNCSPISVGCQVTYACDEGYELTGPSTRTCTANGWSVAAPTCAIVTCGAPDILVNGQANSSTDGSFGDTVTYSCNTNYVLEGDTTSTCQADGEWDGTRTCEYQCDAPTLENGFVNYTCLEENCVANYTCNENYSLQGPSSRRCVADVGYTNSQPACVADNERVTSLTTNFNQADVNTDSPTAYEEFRISLERQFRATMGDTLRNVVVNSVHPNGTVEYSLVIEDSSEANARLSAAFGALSKGTPIEIQGKNVSVQSSSLEGKEVNLADPGTADQTKCETLEFLEGLCPSDTPCDVTNGIPSCRPEEEEDDDNLLLVLLLAIGLPVLAIAAAVTACCCWFFCCRTIADDESESEVPWATGFLPRYKGMPIRFNNANMKGPVYGYGDMDDENDNFGMSRSTSSDSSSGHFPRRGRR